MNATERFFDTNVLIYILSNDAEKADKAEELIASGGIVSVQVLNEFASVATRKLSLKIPEIREILATVRAVCTVQPLDAATHDLGLDLAERYRLVIYDALIAAAAIRAGCTVLYSEDLQHGQKFGHLTVRNPFGH
jgi:predicted nucleic acid-binding protein